MPTIVATIQMRMGSTRFPGKTMTMLCGKPLIGHLLDRVQQSVLLSGIVVATPASSANDVVEKYCRERGIACFRGPEDDVLGRMVGALQSQKADIGVEVYGDSPLIDPRVVDSCIREYLAGHYDWAGNDRSALTTGGLSVEVFSVAALADSANRTQNPAIREHGTLYIRQHPEIYTLKDIEPTGACRRPDLSLDLDEESDAQVLEAILKHFSPRTDFSAEEAVAFLDAHPEIAALSAGVQRRWKQYRIPA